MRWCLFSLGAIASIGCSLGQVARSNCEADDCQRVFGFGSVCQSDGFCARPAANNRCTRTFPANLFSEPEEHPDTIVVGALFDESLGTHQARENAIQIAIQSANESGGLSGRNFGIVFCNIQENSELDSRTRTEAAVFAGSYLARDLGLPAILGPSASSDAQEVFLDLQGTGALIMSPAATSPALTGIDNTSPSDESPGLLWRTPPPDSFQAQEIVDDMLFRGVDSVAVIHATDAYGAGIAEAFDAGFPGETMLLPFTTDAELAERVVTAAGTTVDEVLFVSGQTAQAAMFVNATVGQTGFDTKGIFLTDSAANMDFLTMTSGAGARLMQIRGTRPRTPAGTVYDVFVSLYTLEFGDDPGAFSFTAHAHDAAWLVLYASGWALQQEGAITGQNIARGLRRVSSGTAFDMTTSNFQQIVSAFGRGESVNVRGSSGELDYDPATEETAGIIEVWTVDDL